MAKAVNADADANADTDINISVSQQLHLDVTATTAGAVSLRWWWVGATRAGVGRRNNSGRSKEVVTVTIAAVSGKCAKSRQLEADGAVLSSLTRIF